MHSSPVQRLMALFSGLAVVLLLGTMPRGEACAQAADVYTSPPVPIEARSDSPARARQTAIDQGQAKALQALLESLVAPQDQARLPHIDPARAGALIRDFSIADERTTANSYMATLTARFDTAPVDSILMAAGVPYARPRTEPVLIIPVYSPSPGNSAVLLWEETNPWAREWDKRVSQSTGLVPVVLALGDVEDLDLLNARTAAQAVRNGSTPPDAVRQLALRNGAPDAVVALAEGTPEKGLTVTPVGVGVFGNLAPFTVQPRADAYDYAVAQIRKELDDSWKSQGRPSTGGYGSAVAGPGGYPDAQGADPSTLPPGWLRGTPGQDGPEGTVADGTGAGDPGAWDPGAGPRAGAPLTVIARFNTLNDWVSIRKRLQGLPGVSDMMLQAVSRNQAQLSLHFAGDPDRLRAILATRGLDLSEGDGLWYVDSTGPGTGADQAPGMPGYPDSGPAPLGADPFPAYPAETTTPETRPFLP